MSGENDFLYAKRLISPSPPKKKNFVIEEEISPILPDKTEDFSRSTSFSDPNIEFSAKSLEAKALFINDLSRQLDKVDTEYSCDGNDDNKGIFQFSKKPEPSIVSYSGDFSNAESFINPFESVLKSPRESKETFSAKKTKTGSIFCRTGKQRENTEDKETYAPLFPPRKVRYELIDERKISNQTVFTLPQSYAKEESYLPESSGVPNIQTSAISTPSKIASSSISLIQLAETMNEEEYYSSFALYDSELLSKQTNLLLTSIYFQETRLQKQSFDIKTLNLSAGFDSSTGKEPTTFDAMRENLQRLNYNAHLFHESQKRLEEKEKYLQLELVFREEQIVSLISYLSNLRSFLIKEMDKRNKISISQSKRLQNGINSKGKKKVRRNAKNSYEQANDTKLSQSDESKATKQNNDAGITIQKPVFENPVQQIVQMFQGNLENKKRATPKKEKGRKAMIDRTRLRRIMELEALLEKEKLNSQDLEFNLTWTKTKLLEKKGLLRKKENELAELRDMVQLVESSSSLEMEKQKNSISLLENSLQGKEEKMILVENTLSEVTRNYYLLEEELISVKEQEKLKDENIAFLMKQNNEMSKRLEEIKAERIELESKFALEEKKSENMFMQILSENFSKMFQLQAQNEESEDICLEMKTRLEKIIEEKQSCIEEQTRIIRARESECVKLNDENKLLEENVQTVKGELELLKPRSTIHRRLSEEDEIKILNARVKSLQKTNESISNDYAELSDKILYLENELMRKKNRDSMLEDNFEELVKADETAEAEAKRADEAEVRLQEEAEKVLILQERNCMLEKQIEIACESIQNFEIGSMSRNDNQMCIPGYVNTCSSGMERNKADDTSIFCETYNIAAKRLIYAIKGGDERVAWQLLGRMNSMLTTKKEIDNNNCDSRVKESKQSEGRTRRKSLPQTWTFEKFDQECEDNSLGCDDSSETSDIDWQYSKDFISQLDSMILDGEAIIEREMKEFNEAQYNYSAHSSQTDLSTLQDDSFFMDQDVLVNESMKLLELTKEIHIAEMASLAMKLEER